MTNLENLKKLADGLGADASKCSTNLGALNVISAALGGAGDAETNSQAIEDIAQAAPGAMEQNVVWADGLTGEFNLNGSGPFLGGAFKHVTLPDGVTSIAPGAFASHQNLESVVFPDSVTVINAGSFNNCPKLSSVKLPNVVTEIQSSAFSGCSALESIDLPASLIKIDSNAFAASGLKSIVIPESVEYLETACFGGCEKMENITIKAHNFNISDTAFGGCGSALDSMTIDVYAPENSIEGAPWGATNATVNWLG